MSSGWKFYQNIMDVGVGPWPEPDVYDKMPARSRGSKHPGEKGNDLGGGGGQEQVGEK